MLVLAGMPKKQMTSGFEVGVFLFHNSQGTLQQCTFQFPLKKQRDRRGLPLVLPWTQPVELRTAVHHRKSLGENQLNKLHQ